MFTWAKVGKTKDVRELDAGKPARPDLKERGGAIMLPSTQPKSVDYQQFLVNPVSDCLAGVALGGSHLTNKFSGLVVPICNPDGLFIGWQYRLDRSSGCRYL